MFKSNERSEGSYIGLAVFSCFLSSLKIMMGIMHLGIMHLSSIEFHLLKVT